MMLSSKLYIKPQVGDLIWHISDDNKKEYIGYVCKVEKSSKFKNVFEFELKWFHDGHKILEITTNIKRWNNTYIFTVNK